MSNLKELMVNGIFGENNYGDEFVIVNDHLVYQDGSFDDISAMAKRTKNNDYRVVKLVKGVWSFNQYESGRGEVIFDESKEDKTEGKKDKSVDELVDELEKLLDDLDDVEKDARSKGLSEKEAKNFMDGLFAAASFAALAEIFGKNS